MTRTRSLQEAPQRGPRWPRRRLPLVNGVFTQRPIPAHGGGYRTVVPGAWLIGAATWPAAGVSGSSGRAVARALINATNRRGAANVLG